MGPPARRASGRPISRTSRTRCRRSRLSDADDLGQDRRRRRRHPAGGETRRGGARRRAPDRRASTRCVAAAFQAKEPPSVQGRRPRIYYAHPGRATPPTVVVFSSIPGSVHPSYHRYLSNSDRERVPPERRTAVARELPGASLVHDMAFRPRRHTRRFRGDPRDRPRGARPWSASWRAIRFAAAKFYADGCPTLAAAISFYALLSLIPVFFLVIAGRRVRDRLVAGHPIRRSSSGCASSSRI